MGSLERKVNWQISLFFWLLWICLLAGNTMERKIVKVYQR